MFLVGFVRDVCAAFVVACSAVGERETVVESNVRDLITGVPLSVKGLVKMSARI